MKYIAHFQAEAWVRDNAEPVDAQGPDEWDCTAFVSTLDERTRAQIDKAIGCYDRWLDCSDELMEDPARPDWIKAWRGPFTIRVTKDD